MAIKILLVEDKPEIRTILSEVLKLHDFDVTSVKNGLQAIEQVKEEKPDVIIMDIRMPKMDGIEATKFIKKHYAIPVIILSAYTDKKSRRLAKEAGADEFIAKPVDYEKLDDKIRYLAAIADNDDNVELDSLRRRLNLLKEKQAMLGLDTPPHVIMEIEDIEGKLNG